MNIYFAGSIRGGRDDKELYSEIIQLLSNYGTVLTEHIGKKTLSELGETEVTTEFIYNRDLDFLRKSEVIVAEVTNPSLGVGYEIAKSEQWNKKILCLFRPSEEKRLSAMIAGNNKVKVVEYQKTEELEDIFNKFFGLSNIK